MEKPLPVVLALVVADHIYHDDISGKLFILGARLAIPAQSFPFHLPRLAAVATLVEGRGKMSFEVRLADVDDERDPIFETEVAVTFPDPLTEVELVFEMSDLVFQEPGEYRLQLRTGGELLRERRLVVSPRET